MILKRGDMWSQFGMGGLFMLTTNPIIKRDGSVVMGRGIALQAKKRFPKLPFDFARQLTRRLGRGLPKVGTIGRYGGQAVGYFMVKRHWQHPAELSIIADSVTALIPFSRQYSIVNLNFPGIGNGKLKREDVLPLLEVLPNNIHVWEYE